MTADLKSQLRKRVPALLATLLWLGLFGTFAIELSQRSTWSAEPTSGSLNVLQGSVESVEGCFGVRGLRYVVARLRDSTAVRIIELPCDREFIELPRGTYLTVQSRKITSLLNSERDDVWDVRSDSRVYLEPKQRTERSRSGLSTILRALVIGALLLGAALLTIVLRAAWKDANDA